MKLKTTLVKSISIIAASIMLGACSSPSHGSANSNKQEVSQASSSTNKQETSQAATKQGNVEYGDKIKGLEKVQAKVTRVVDGDTLKIVINKNNDNNAQKNGKSEEITVRMLLLDTAESVKPGMEKPMKYGKEASNYTKNLLEGKNVELVFDKGDKEDHYGRKLCYVYLDGKNVEADILRQGLGVVRYIKEPNTTLYNELKQAEKEAERNKKGVFSIPGYVVHKGKESSYDMQKAF